MSTDAAVPTAQQDAEVLIPLLKEYAAKLRTILDQSYYPPPSEQTTRSVAMVGLRAQRFLGYLKEQYRTLQPFVEKLASHASQLLEHTELDYFTGIELKLRLSELELALRQAKGRFAEKQDTENSAS